MVNEIVLQIKKFCEEEGVEEPNIYTEFGSFTVGESGGNLYRSLARNVRMTEKMEYDR
jgi:arginine decarboxylase